MSGTETLFSALLKLTRLRQIEVARELDVSRSTLAGWLAGYSPMPDEVVLKIHRLISIRLGRLEAKNPTGENHHGDHKP
jgi:transcriptional regulator with XRE-family HTH domain